MVVTAPLVHGLADLAQVFRAENLARARARAGQRGQHDAREQRERGEDGEQFDPGESRRRGRGGFCSHGVMDFIE